ncbi:MAG: sugar phosphate isomerase/epimerase [Caldilineaceae bacterium]|nr:sugar phosphate isomerase/epimerase [Caldilineaceae bacterium]
MKLGYSTWGMPNHSIDQAVDQIASLGFDGIEISVLDGWTTFIDNLDAVERKRILKLLNDKGLTLSAIYGCSSLLGRDPAAQEANGRRLYEAIDLATEWAQDGRLPYVNILSGGRTADWEAQHEALVERIVPFAKYAEERGVVLAMEPHVDGLVDMPDKTLTILKLVDSSALKVNFDISHFDIFGMSIEESVTALVPHSVHAHVKDQRGRYPNYEFLVPGDGDFDYVAYLQAMQAHGYTGFITAEVSKMVQNKPGYDPVAACELTYRTLAKAFVDAGIARQ